MAFGHRAGQPVVLKVLRHPSDEWLCGEVLEAFYGAGVVRVYDYIEGAVLLERLTPGTSLSYLALSGQDEEATDILADVIHRMSQPLNSSFNSLERFVTVKDWGRGFDRYLARGDCQIPRSFC